MSLESLPSSRRRQEPGQTAPSHVGRSQPGRVQGKVKAAVLSMAWEGLTFAQAARKANLSAYAMRLALERPNVQAYLRQQRQVFRASLTDRATFRMLELSEQDENKAAAVTATRALMCEDDQSVNGAAAQRVPGLQIVIMQQAGGSQAVPKHQVIDAIASDINGLPDKST